MFAEFRGWENQVRKVDFQDLRRFFSPANSKAVLFRIREIWKKRETKYSLREKRKVSSRTKEVLVWGWTQEKRDHYILNMAQI